MWNHQLALIKLIFLFFELKKHCFFQNWLHSAVSDVQLSPRQSKPHRSSPAFRCCLPHHTRPILIVIRHVWQPFPVEIKLTRRVLLRFPDEYSHDCGAEAGAKNMPLLFLSNGSGGKWGGENPGSFHSGFLSGLWTLPWSRHQLSLGAASLSCQMCNVHVFENHLKTRNAKELQQIFISVLH